MHDSNPGVYSHSGKLGVGLFLVPIGGVILSLILSAVYSYVDVYSPIAGYISLLFLGLFTFALGWSISKVGHLAHCRNTGFMALNGFVFGLFGLYASWAVFEYALLNRFGEDFNVSLLAVLLSPGGVWEIAKEINTNGWYSIFGGTPKGTGLWIIWGIEAVCIVGGTTLFSIAAISDEVFCEPCGRWCRKMQDLARLDFPQTAEEMDGLSPENLAPIRELLPADADASAFIRVDGWECTSCGDTAALQVKSCAITVGDDGKPEENTNDLTEIWTVANATLKEFRRLGLGANLGGSGEEEVA